MLFSFGKRHEACGRLPRLISEMRIYIYFEEFVQHYLSLYALLRRIIYPQYDFSGGLKRLIFKRPHIRVFRGITRAS